MKYFDPPNIHVSILKKANIQKTVQVPIRPSEGSVLENCLNNASNYIAKHGGDIQLGWIFSIMGNIALKLTSHAVVKMPNSELVCITPHQYRIGKLRFTPDHNIENLKVNNHLPIKLIPLIDDPVLDEYLVLQREMDQLRLNGGGLVPTSQVQRIELMSQLIYPAILKLAKENTSFKDYCFCGSNRKWIKCCKF